MFSSFFFAFFFFNDRNRIWKKKPISFRIVRFCFFFFSFPFLSSLFILNCWKLWIVFFSLFYLKSAVGEFILLSFWQKFGRCIWCANLYLNLIEFTKISDWKMKKRKKREKKRDEKKSRLLCNEPEEWKNRKKQKKRRSAKTIAIS